MSRKKTKNPLTSKKGFSRRAKGQIHSGSVLFGLALGFGVSWLYQDYIKRQQQAHAKVLQRFQQRKVSPHQRKALVNSAVGNPIII